MNGKIIGKFILKMFDPRDSLTLIKKATDWLNCPIPPSQEERNYQQYINFLNFWIKELESKYRFDEGYPRDWLARRQYVFLRDKKQCGYCGTGLKGYFSPSDNWEKDLLRENVETWSTGRCRIPMKYGWIIENAHVHHSKSLKQGGTHNLDNLILLCEKCHATQSGHKLLRSGKCRAIKARTEHKCGLCGNKIDKNEKYYYGIFNSCGHEICSKCYNQQ